VEHTLDQLREMFPIGTYVFYEDGSAGGQYGETAMSVNGHGDVRLRYDSGEKSLFYIKARKLRAPNGELRVRWCRDDNGTGGSESDKASYEQSLRDGSVYELVKKEHISHVTEAEWYYYQRTLLMSLGSDGMTRQRVKEDFDKLALALPLRGNNEDNCCTVLCGF
jgi:hypothetical protein